MSWYTLDEAETLGPSSETWRARARAEEVSSYTDSHGRQWVWVDAKQATQGAWGREPELIPLWEDVASLRREVSNLYARRVQVETPPQLPLALRLVEPQVSLAAAPCPVEDPIEIDEPQAHAEPTLTIHRSTRAQRPAAAPASRGEEILTWISEHWSGSDRELERQANLPKAFLAKAKKGQRNGPRSAASWDRLESFVRGRRAA